jgi:uncharacterized protein YukE
MPPIHINYDNVFRQAARLQQIGEEHRRAADALEAERSRIASAWRDPAGAAYSAAASQLAADMRATAEELVRLAAQIRNAAAQFKAQEEANTKAARGLAN